MNGLIGSLSTTISFFLEQILMEGGEELKSLARCPVWNVRKFVDSSCTKKGKNLQSPTFHSILNYCCDYHYYCCDYRAYPWPQNIFKGKGAIELLKESSSAQVRSFCCNEITDIGPRRILDQRVECPIWRNMLLVFRRSVARQCPVVGSFRAAQRPGRHLPI